MERGIDSIQDCQFSEGLHGRHEGQNDQTRFETSQIQPSESPLPPIESIIAIGSVSPIEDSNRNVTLSQSPSRQKNTQKRRDNKSTSKSESKPCDMPLKRQSRKASSKRLPTSPVSSSTTKCLATTSPSSVVSLTTTTAITALSALASHLVSPMDTIDKGPPGKEKKSKESKRKRAKKSRSSQRSLVPGDPVLAISKESDLNDAVISQSTTIAPPGRPGVSSTNARVQAAKEFLNVSCHDFPRVTSDKGQENKRATKKKLANLSLERESLHRAKPRSSRNRSSFSNKLPSPKKTNGSRQSKIRPAQKSPDAIQDNLQQRPGMNSMPKPNPTVTRRVQSFGRTDDAQCTASDISRHERRIAARNELEAISTHMRHRSHSRSLRTSESSIRRQVDRTSSPHAASSHTQSFTSEVDITRTLIIATGNSSTDEAPAYQASSMLSSPEQPSCLASKSEPSQPTEYREHRSVGSIEIDDEVNSVNSFACSLDSHVSQNTRKELVLQSIQDDALQIIRMLPPKLGSKSMTEEKRTLEIASSHSEKAPPSKQSSIVSTDMLLLVSTDMLLHLPPKPDPVTRHSGGLSGSLHRRTDLQSFLKHVALLNDFKALTDLSSASDSAELGQSELINLTVSPSKFRRFQRFFQLKCRLFNILRQEDHDEDANRLRQTLLQFYDVEPMDLDFVLEHLALCEQEKMDIRWDLVRMIFFPEDENPCHHHSHNHPESRLGHHSLPILGHSSNTLVASHEKRLWHSNVDFPTWNSLSDSVYLEKSHASSDRCNHDEDMVDEQPTCWSPMEEFQEEILELFESVESSMADLPLEQQKERRLVLVELLQATSEEEAHMTTLSFDDMAEIVRHIRVCRKTNTDVQWDMIRDIVFPFGVNSFDPLLKRTGGECSRDWSHESSMGNSSILHHSFRSVEHFDDGVLRVLDSGDHAIDISGKLSDMAGEELEVVLQHIQVAKRNDAPIRWDLIGHILYPGDPERQSIFLMA